MGRPCKCCEKCCSTPWILRSFYPIDLIRYYRFSSDSTNGDLVFTNSYNCGGGYSGGYFFNFYKVINLPTARDNQLYSISASIAGTTEQQNSGYDYGKLEMSLVKPFEKWNIKCSNETVYCAYPPFFKIKEFGLFIDEKQNSDSTIIQRWYTNGFQLGFSSNNLGLGCLMVEKFASVDFDGVQSGCYLLELSYNTGDGMFHVNPAISFDITISLLGDIVDIGNFNNILITNEFDTNATCLPLSFSNQTL